MKLGIVKSNKAFFPESKAYKKYLSNIKNLDVEFYSNYDEACQEAQIVIIYFGFIPFWKKNKNVYTIAEYHSLSTGSYSRLKDVIKRIFNIRGDYYIFLNDQVRKGLYFSSKIPHIFRGMGYDANLVSQFLNEEKKYDFVYAGSLSREGVIDKISYIAALGFKFVVVGNTKDEEVLLKKNNKEIICMGKLPLEDSYQIIASSTYGLNYTPDIYPFNIQDSTKIIEYTALGLKIISNKYEWIDQFESKNGLKFLDIDDIHNKDDVLKFNFKSSNIENLRWDNIIINSGLYRLIEDITKRNHLKD